MKAARTRRAATECMNYGYAVNLGAGLENGGEWVGTPAFRCGLPLRGGGWLIRDAGPRLAVPAVGVRGTVVPVVWRGEVAWRKQSRFANR